MSQNDRCCILNVGPGAWAFEEHAARLSRSFGVDVATAPREFNYTLSVGDGADLSSINNFIPWRSIEWAGDKRLLAEAFEAAGVRTPRTHLVDSPDEVWRVCERRGGEWCLKWPTGCAAAGHRLILDRQSIPEDWPRPYVVQAFVRQEDPEVYRLYGVAGNLFGWNVRRFPAGARRSPWVAHARGARYVRPGAAPAEAVEQARAALVAAGLVERFGCVDLLQDSDGQWLVLEVGTDGLHNHVDRDVGDAMLAEEIDSRLAAAFRAWCQ